MTRSITFVSTNRVLAGQTVTIEVGDNVRFHPSGHMSFYSGRVIDVDTTQVTVRVVRSLTGRGNTGMHRWRTGRRARISLDEIYAVMPRRVSRESSKDGST